MDQMTDEMSPKVTNEINVITYKQDCTDLANLTYIAAVHTMLKHTSTQLGWQ